MNKRIISDEKKFQNSSDETMYSQRKHDEKNLKSKKSKFPKMVVSRVNLLFFSIGFFSCGLIMIGLNVSLDDRGLILNEQQKSSFRNKPQFSTDAPTNFNIKSPNKHKLAIVVPFRDRFDELLLFVPHMSKYLSAKSIDFKIYIINQKDRYRFNRASLINVGFLLSAIECDYMAMHDIDLLPLNDQLDYGYPLNNNPYHVSAPGLHPEYNYKTFIGGILIVTKDNFLKTNGMSNRYWGWGKFINLKIIVVLNFDYMYFITGKEDDEFYLRLNESNINIDRPNLSEIKTNGGNTFFHNHEADVRPRDKKRFLKQKKESLKRDLTGLDSLQYRILETNQVFVDGFVCTIVNVELFCNKHDTHWCDTSYQFLD